MKSVSELSLEQAPPLRILLRFFLTAPLFGMAAGGLLLVMGPDALTSRWLPGAMALTHLFALGFITMAMCGAVLQVLPVLGGVPVPGVITLGPAVHLLLTLGTLALVSGFVSGYRLAFDLAVIGLSGGLALFLGAVALGLWRVRTLNPTVRGIWAALVALFLALFLGIYLALVLSGPGSGPHMRQVVELHLGWALLGWVGLLIMGVGFQVVPLFQMTREYPNWLVGWGPAALLLILLLWSGTTFTAAAAWRVLAESLLAVVFCTFAATTLWLQRERRRRVADAGVLFWRVSALALLVAAALWGVGIWPASGKWSWFPTLWGVVVLGGVAVTLIIGMLCKIVPFLSWFHLQQRLLALPHPERTPIPHMQQLLPVRLVVWQFRLHLSVLLLAAVAAVYPQYLARLLGLMLLLSFGLLEYGLLKTGQLYRRTEIQLSATTPAEG